MNKNIKKLIDMYFTYRPTKDMEIITEEYHIASTYIKVINQIVNLYLDHISDNRDSLVYTGYNLNIDTQEVLKLNNENKYIPIYALFIFTDDTTTYSSVVDKDDSPNKIIVLINVNYINNRINDKLI